MDPDILFFAGMVTGVFAVPSILSAVADGRAPRASALLVLISGSLILYAVSTNPSGYTWQDMPRVFFDVLGQFIG